MTSTRKPTFLNAYTIGFIALACLCFVAYSNSFRGSFQYDDLRLIRFNFSLRDLANLKEIALQERSRPLLAATFALNFKLGGNNPYSYHVVNLVLHFLATFLFYVFLQRQSQNTGFSLIAAALMAVHPLNTESVSYVASRSIVLCSVFYILSLIWFDQHLRKPRWYYATATIITFALGALVKEEAGLIPLSALLYNYIVFGSSSVKKHRRFHLSMFLLLLAAGTLRIYVYWTSASASAEPLAKWIPTEINVWLRYLWLAFFPTGLNVDHDIHPLSFTSPVFWFSLMVIIGILYALFRLRKTHPMMTFWGTWFFVNLLASSSIIPLNEFMAEHLTYISMFGFCACLAYVCTFILRPMIKPASLVTVILLLLIAGYVAGTLHRNTIWKDDLSLWADTAKKSPTKIRPRLNLAQAYIQRKSYDAAIEEYEYVLQLNSDLPHVYSGLGIAYLRKRDLDRSRFFFEKALHLDPNFTDAKTGVGMIHYQIGDYQVAEAYLKEIYPDRRESTEVLAMLVDSCRRTGKFKEAIQYLESGIQNSPSFAILYPTLMETYLLAGNYEEASKTYDRYRSHFPTDAAVLLRTSEMLQKIGRKKDALAILKEISRHPEYGEEAQRRLKALAPTS